MVLERIEVRLHTLLCLHSRRVDAHTHTHTHTVVATVVQDIAADELSKRLPRELMLEHRAQLFEAINLEKMLVSRRRGALIYKHISIIDLKARWGRRGGVHSLDLTLPFSMRSTSPWGISATTCAASSPKS